MKNIFVLFFLLFHNITFTQTNHTHTRIIDFPNLPDYESIICDFHQHTIFSDGSVFPNIRVQEALRDSVDAISLTEHLEYLPHKKDIPLPNRNRAYELAEKYARPFPLIAVNGVEITRKMPPGHSNAIFIEDANKLLIEDSIEVFREVQRQGGFVFWNHPNWIPQQKDGIAQLSETHKFLIKEDLLHGIEVVNGLTYSDEALQIALDNNLTIMGGSDIHGLVDWKYKIAEGGHRAVTIVFGKEKTTEGIKEALFARRTVVFFNQTLIGKKENLVPLIEACLEIEKAEYQGISSVLNVKIYNNSSAEFILGNLSDFTFHAHMDMVILPPKTLTTIQVKTKEQLSELNLAFTVLNAVIAPKVHPEIMLKIVVGE